MAETNSSSTKNIGRWCLVAFGVFALTVLGGVYVTNQILPKSYSATVEIQTSPAGSSVGHLDNGPVDKPFDPTNFQYELEIIQSNEVLLPIINDLSLDQIWAQRLHPGTKEKMHPLEALAYLRKHLKVELRYKSDLTTITVTSENPQEAAAIANAIADRYTTMRQVQQDQRSSRNGVSLRDQIEQQQKVIEEKKAALDKLRDEEAQNGVQLSAPTPELQRAEKDLEERKKDLKAAEEDYEARKALLEKSKKIPDDKFDYRPPYPSAVDQLNALGRQEPNIAALRTEIIGIQGDIDNLVKDGFEPDHPRVLALKAEIVRKQQQIKDMIAAMRREMQVDTDMAKARVELLQKDVDELTLKVHPELKTYRDAFRDIQEQQSLLDALRVRLKQVEADKALQANPVRIVSRAQAPTAPSSPNRALCLAITAVAGILMGTLVATLVEGRPLGRREIVK